MKRTRKTFYRKKTAQLPKEKKVIKKEERRDEFFDKYIAPALSTSNLRNKALYFSVLFLVLLFVFGIIQGIFIYLNYSTSREMHEAAVADLRYWEAAIERHPNSPDIYYNAAIFAFKLGQKDKAHEYLKTAKVLDPDFRDAGMLEEAMRTQ